MRIAMTQEIEERDVQQFAINNVHFVDPNAISDHHNYRPNYCYHQGATITEIDEQSAILASAVDVVVDDEAVFNVVTAEAVVSEPIIHPKAVHASPVMVLQDEQQHRNKLRQRALVESVESKV